MWEVQEVEIWKEIDIEAMIHTQAMMDPQWDSRHYK